MSKRDDWIDYFELLRQKVEGSGFPGVVLFLGQIELK